LARYLTAPIRRLHRATEAYAEGDFNQLVGPSLGRRRDEIADLAQAFDRMARRLHGLMESHKQLLRDVSHELRSPLARLQVALGLARQRSEGRADAELGRMEREIERLNDLIGQLLSLARLETGAAPPGIETVDLAELLESVVADADFEARAQGRSVRILRSTPAEIPATPALLHSALENVVRNAVRHTAPGTAVEVTLDREAGGDRRVRVTIRDHGPGIPAAVLARVAQPFVRLSDGADGRSGGFGLGLAIADRAVRLHGGTLTLCNAPNGGLVVTIALVEAG
jgi:two-component system sensor histidine kinase CpxA